MLALGVGLVGDGGGGGGGREECVEIDRYGLLRCRVSQI